MKENEEKAVKARKVRSLDTYAKQKGIKRPRKSKLQEKDKGKYFKGSALINALWVRMTELNHTPHELAYELGVSYPYVMQLGKGKRPASGLSIETYRRAANYLNMSTATVATLAEAFEPRDFYLQATLEDRIEIAFKSLKADPLVGGFAVPNELWNSLAPAVKFLIAVLYENGAKTNILDATKLFKIEKQV